MRKFLGAGCGGTAGKRGLKRDSREGDYPIASSRNPTWDVVSDPRGLKGQADHEAAPRSRRRLEGQAPAVGEHNGPGDGEPETGTPRLPGPGGVEADEWLEDPLRVGGRDAD